MKKLALLLVLAVELAVCGCGNPPIQTVVTTSSSGNWEAQLFSNNAPVSNLNFVTSFNITNTTGFPKEPLDITGFGFFNSGPCFDTGLTKETEVGTATLDTDNAGQVTGSFTFTITSITIPGNVLTLTTSPNGALTGISNGTTTTTGTLSQGVVVGTWTLKSSNPSCNNSNPNNTNTFLMCQGAATCTPPA
ncbi:MAG: hypothetical protein WCF26_08450 [Candidatus Sulfotelmatobacter sp.]